MLVSNGVCYRGSTVDSETGRRSGENFVLKCCEC